MKTIGTYCGALIMIWLLLSGCQVAHMALPQDLKSGASEMIVEGRSALIFGKPLNFGVYQVNDINRGWTKGKGWSISEGNTEFSASEAEQKYEFRVSESGHATWEVRCATGADWSQLETEGLFGGGFGIEFSSNKQLACILKQEGNENISRLLLSQSANAGETALQGVMMYGTTQIKISATHKLDSTPLPLSDPTGYIFQIEGRPMGAVEVINKGTVWLNNGAAPEISSALAATSAVLLLYQDIQKNLQRK
ncbi:MAG: hypothetical protein KAR06_08725 [Deltaproteobacteria bacterium]|nr:hypothetical protein [Deltaproteobacteria bacterium]